MTILKEVTLPTSMYFAPSIEIASQVEIDKIAEYYSRKNNGMRIAVLGSSIKVAPGETVFVVAHGNARGDFTKMSLDQLRGLLIDHGVTQGMKVMLAGCFTKTTAVDQLPSAHLDVDVDGYHGVLNVAEDELRDLKNDDQSEQLHARRTGKLETQWKACIVQAQNVLRDLGTKGATPANACEFKDFFDLFEAMTPVKAVLAANFGNATSPKSYLSTIRSWFNNASNASWRSNLWPVLFAATACLARTGDFIVRDPGGKGSDGTGKQALIAAALKLDSIHSRIFVEAETEQARYQQEIHQKLDHH